MPKITTDRKEDKVSRIISAVSSLHKNEFIALSAFARSIGLHPHTVKDKLDEWQTFIEAGRINIIRDHKDIRGIMLTEDDRDLNFKKEIRNTLKEIRDTLDIINFKYQELSNKLDRRTKNVFKGQERKISEREQKQIQEKSQ